MKFTDYELNEVWKTILGFTGGEPPNLDGVEQIFNHLLVMSGEVEE